MSVTILGIDPGTTETGWAKYNLSDHAVIDCGVTGNAGFERMLRLNDIRANYYACEWVESFGMPVGKEIFETVHFIGRISTLVPIWRVTRKEVKLNLCNSARAKDKNIRQAIIDRFEPTGGGKLPQVGTKNKPGPLYGVTSHKVSALAVAITFAETKLNGKRNHN
jgi:hypothetical protein